MAWDLAKESAQRDSRADIAQSLGLTLWGGFAVLVVGLTNPAGKANGVEFLELMPTLFSHSEHMNAMNAEGWLRVAMPPTLVEPAGLCLPAVVAYQAIHRGLSALMSYFPRIREQVTTM